jgi:hypothetical protein
MDQRTQPRRRRFRPIREDAAQELARVRRPGSGYMSTPFAENVEVSVRIN